MVFRGIETQKPTDRVPTLNKYIGGRGKEGLRVRGPFRGQNVCRLEEVGGRVAICMSGVEGGLRPVPRGRPAKKQTKKHAVYSISAENGKWSKKVYF